MYLTENAMEVMVFDATGVVHERRANLLTI